MIPDSIKEVLRRETENSPVTEFEGDEGGKYPYTILPMESFALPEYFSAIREGLKIMLKDEIEKADAILSIEAKAYLITTSLAEEFNLPHIAVRKRDYRIKDQVVIKREKKKHRKAYAGSENLYCVGLNKLKELNLKRILIVEDMISGGGTLLGTIKAIEDEGFEIAGIGTVYERGDGVKKINKAGYEAKGLMRLEIEGDKRENWRPVVTGFYGD
ncbi:MAG: phosphoribosyltransferase [archaeon]|nr:MAG: phosphoribosyltransferase [archaeon]